MDEKINVLEFIYYMFDGGAEKIVKDYCISIDKRRFNPIVLTLYPNINSTVYKDLQEHNIKIYSIFPKRNNFFRAINFLFGRIIIGYKLKKIIKKEKINVIHSHAAVLHYLLYAGKNLQGIKLFYTCHNKPDIYFSGRLKKEYYAAEELINQYGMQIIALHDDMKDELNGLFHIKNTIVINNCIDLEKYKFHPTDKLQIRKLLGIPENAYVIGNVGRFYEQKNHVFLVKLFKEIIKIKPDAYLLLIGDGILKEMIINDLESASLSNNYLILSNRDDIPELLFSMDIFVFPSLYEGLPLALLEAQAAGINCVVSDKIPDAACVTELVKKLKLDEPIENWINAIINPIKNERSLNNLDSFDIMTVTKQIESIYGG